MLSKKDAIASGSFQHYIAKAPDREVLKSIQKNTKAFKKFLKHIPSKKRDYAYAPGKWTINQVLQHIIDAERVFSYRAVRIARLDATPMPGFDENAWADAANQTHRKWNDLVEEFASLRAATEWMFSGLGDKELVFEGMASNTTINALALGYVIAGHVQHHMDIIKERYL